MWHPPTSLVTLEEVQNEAEVAVVGIEVEAAALSLETEKEIYFQPVLGVDLARAGGIAKLTEPETLDRMLTETSASSAENMTDHSREILAPGTTIFGRETILQ